MEQLKLKNTKILRYVKSNQIKNMVKLGKMIADISGDQRFAFHYNMVYVLKHYDIQKKDGHYQYIDPKNRPKKLDYKNTKNSFCDLIKKARINATPNSALQEFKRLGLVKINEDEKICLLRSEVINDSNEEIFHARLSSHLNKSQ